jgi:precorrin-2/cobalt-factor-2 C20-methyltransferase
MSTFYLVGVGPGDPDLLTLRAAKILERSPVWFTPRASAAAGSTALAIAGAAVDSAAKEIIAHTFPMKKIHMGETPDPEVVAAWQAAAAIISARLADGKDVAFPTLGDPALYSTAFYVCDTLLALDAAIQVKIVPGVSSIGAAAAAVGRPLCQGDERLVVLPATYENGFLAETLAAHDTVVLMKVHRDMPRVQKMLADLGLLEQATLVERVGQQGERVVRGLADFDPAQGCHYFSTVIIKCNQIVNKRNFNLFSRYSRIQSAGIHR